ncbi:PilW family protein [Rheinheimera metallidurans]|uniref:PilW family protein n=1 Tax=Rheinheimera metallidurans TaxID=2925781 RepID=UPI0030024763
MWRKSGFTLTELLIAMLLGVFLLGMVITAFSTVSRSTRQAQQLAELQQNAQLLMTLLQNELTNTGFWGGRSMPEQATLFALPAIPSNDCAESIIDSGSFPQLAKSFVTLYAKTITSNQQQLNCVNNPLPQTELLQVKRLIGLNTPVSEMRQNRFYLETNWQHARFVDSDSPALHQSYSYYPYQHLVFYLAQQQVNGENIPVLMRKRLSRNQAGQAVMSTDSILDGVERMHFEFGVDSTFDGELNYYQATNQVPAELWQQQSGRIVSLRYYLLLRAKQADSHYTNQQVYVMGQQQFVAPSDNYRRLLVSSSIYFHNTAL